MNKENPGLPAAESQNGKNLSFPRLANCTIILDFTRADDQNQSGDLLITNYVFLDIFLKLLHYENDHFPLLNLFGI